MDPLKEANAQTVRLANHTTTLARECAREGLDWEDVLRQRAKELQMMVALGVASQPTSPEEEEDADDGDE